MLIQRLLAAIVLIPLVIILLFFTKLSIFASIMIAVGGIAAWEWSQFLYITNKHSRLIFAFFIAVLLALLYFMPIPFELKSKLYNIILSLSIIWWLVALYLVMSYPKTIHYWSNIAVKLFFAFFTLFPFFISVIALRSIDYQSNCYTGAILLLYIFVLVWTTDTGAYFAGRTFGKRKLAPKVSPGKTVEGFIGGVSVALLISLVVYYSNLFNLKLNAFFISSFFAILASVLGDLTESMFKREAGIKDSGNLIPGHGGILDRIDSLTAAVPIFTVLSLYLS
ncbi:hypothetical protein B6D19_05890 [Gilliamella apicola]|uniref:phosphatidate cytidylyltransferase n=1 Tax=Gilliamella apicola TaxID=1196095 RepID=UPI000A3482E3|nr:phosphatidate cytidylyltransferase [Gilliamella apicola]OTQ32282.1 hypothetical protein B6D19_05890 [Gilliamella apicola]OTQ46722.1 hypothetical protein B6D20_01920 [Gilliamella apicola]